MTSILPRLCIGMDSFDTPLTGCTTHFATLLLKNLQAKKLAKPLGYPFLARLNPTIPWKTRGNGSVALELTTTNTSSVTRATEKLAEEYAAGSKKASLVIAECSEKLLVCTQRIYRKAITTLLLDEDIKECLDESNNKILYTYGENRIGIRGALAAIGALTGETNTTYELITYRVPDKWGTRRVIDEKSVILFDQLWKPYTFLNYDYLNQKILIAPHGPDPVLYGIRGEKPNILLNGYNIIKTGENISHWTLFRTNQATNIHLTHSTITNIRPYTNVIVEGIVEDYRETEKGHLILLLCWLEKCVHAAAYRETGRLRKYLKIILEQQTPSGIKIRVAGGVKQHQGKLTINIEYVDIPLPKILEKNITPLLSNSIIIGNYARILPDPSAFHHLMKPLERYIIFK